MSGILGGLDKCDVGKVGGKCILEKVCGKASAKTGQRDGGGTGVEGAG